MISRRGLLASIIASCAAPAIISTPGLLMPIKPQLTVTPWDDLMIDCFADGGKPSIMLVTKDMYDRFQKVALPKWRVPRQA